MIRSNYSRVLAMLLATLAAATLLAVLAPTDARALPPAVQQDAGCLANTLPRNDDGSTGRITLPFQINFFGQNYGSTFVNNNGNVTFNGPLGTFTPFDLRSTQTPIIAPFFADVDTRAQGSDVVTYGNATFGGRDAFCVNWTGVAGGVGYYASHADKLNSFQLLLVDRSDIGPGDFDIIINYDKIQWETGGGRGGLGGNSARMGYSNGSNASFELPGSAVNGAFLDSNPQTGLIHNSRDSLQLGRYVYEVRNGEAPVGGTISGSVFRNSVDPNNALQGALVQVCGDSGSCNTSSTNSTGAYSVSGLAEGGYEVRAFPPAGSSLSPGEIGPIALSNGQTLAGQNVVLTGPEPPPPDTSIDNDTQPGQIPVVIVRQPLLLQTTGCEGGTATYEVAGEYGGRTNGSMVEGPAGTYTANFSLPFTGPATVTITIDCPGADDETTEFNIYIDPSGYVRDTDGDPIEGATVTLYRSDTSAGPFEVVPNGSAIMSPSNRANPDTTDAEDPNTAFGEGGHFGWDVIAGYYKVRAEKEGCVSPDDPNRPYVESEVLEIPPPVTNLDLRLDCQETADNTPPELRLPADLTVEATSSDGATINYEATATDEDPANPEVTCAPASGDTFPIGPTTVNCSATDAAGNNATGSFGVVVSDSIPPAVVCDEPDGLWHNANVGIDCEASDFFLADPAGASFTLSTSVPEGEENANAQTNSRDVCDTSGNCVTAGPIAGNKVDRKAP